MGKQYLSINRFTYKERFIEKIAEMANPPTKGSMGLSKFGKQHPLKNDVRLVILVCFILILPV